MQFDEADKANVEYIQKLEKKNRTLKKKLKKVIVPKVKKVVKPLAIDWKASRKVAGAIAKLDKARDNVHVLQKLINETKFYNNLRNRVTELRKKYSKLPQLKNKYLSLYN